jgi:hypothetical protein
MTFMTRLRSIFRRRRFNLAPGHHVQLAFTAGGIDYYHFPDILAMGFERALSALTFYEELRCRTTREYLIAHCQAVENLLSGTKINLGQVAVLNQNLKDRLAMIIEPDIVYKLASVLYFDSTEDPYRYDLDYGMKKVERWKEDLPLTGFFLSTPIKDLIPGLASFEENLASYSQVVATLNDKMFQTILSHLSEQQQLHESVKRSSSQSGSRHK